MSSLFDKLNLRPQERRLVVVAGIAIFVVVNYMFVWSHFGDLGIWQQQKKDRIRTLENMRAEIRQTPTYELQRNELRESGSYVPTFQASTRLRRQVQDQAIASKVRLGNISPRNTLSASNSFFEEKGLVVTYQAGEQELVDFLYNLGTNDSLIRVSEFTVGPDTRLRTELHGRITFVGSFQKTPSPRSSPPAAAPPATVKPAATSPPQSVTSTAPTPAKPATPKTKSSPAPAPAPPKSTIPTPPKTKTSPGDKPRPGVPVAAPNMGTSIPRRVIPGKTTNSPNK